MGTPTPLTEFVAGLLDVAVCVGVLAVVVGGAVLLWVRWPPRWNRKHGR